MHTIPLETDRLILRKFEDKDMQPLHLLLMDETVNTFLPWFPVKSLEDTRTFYETHFAGKAYPFAIWLQSGNIPSG